MDIDAQFEQLVGPDYQDLSSDEERQRIEAALDTEGYIPSDQPSGQTLYDEVGQDVESDVDVLSTALDPNDADRYNPGIEGYQEHVSWTPSGWGPSNETGMLPGYPEYLPTDEAIERAIDYSPLVEVGAGHGYWTHVINQNGGDCLATDISVPRTFGEVPQTLLCNEDGDRLPFTPTVWADIREADHSVVTEHPERNVLLCHPPVAEWVEDLLTLMDPSQKLVLVAAWYPGADATPLFFHRLHTQWRLCDEFPVYNWRTTHAHGYVFEKRSAADGSE